MRKRNNLLVSCKGEALISFQSSEEVALLKRKTAFLKSPTKSGELCKFSEGVKKCIEEYRISKQTQCNN